MGSWELCISVQENCFKFALCRLNKNNLIEVAKAFQIDMPLDFKGFTDHAQIVSSIKQGLKENGVSEKNYKLCMSDRDIINRVVKLPKMKPADLKSFMKLSIEQYFPIRNEEYYFDYKVQSINEEDEKAYFSLFLVAIPKAIIGFYSELLLKCGLRPKNITIYSDSISNLFINLVNKNVAIMDMSYNFTEFVMMEGKNIFINSALNYALPRNAGTINEETYLKHLSEEELGEDFFATCDTLENYINFFSSRHHGQNIEEIYFIGEGSKLGILSSIEQEMNIKINTGKDLFEEKIIITSMARNLRSNFHPENYCCCFGLVAGGINNGRTK